MNTNTITGPKYGESRDMPWNVMGHNLKPSSATNLSKALKDAGLDYQVETWDVQAINPADKRVRVDASKSRAVVRPLGDGMAVVGMVGTRYTPIQNADAFAIATDLVGDFGATIDGLADFRHGGASVMALGLNQDIVLRTPDGGEDVTALNLLVKNSHDGASALTFALTPFRLACTNALQGAISGAKRSWKIAHTPNAAERVDLARTAILEAIGFREAFQVVAQDMMDAAMVEAEFAKIVANLIPVKDDATGKVAERKREAQATILSLYRESPTLDGIRGTRWGGYNALTEYLDHYRPVKGNPAVAHAEGQIEGPNVRVKQNVFRMFAAA